MKEPEMEKWREKMKREMTKEMTEFIHGKPEITVEGLTDFFKGFNKKCVDASFERAISSDAGTGYRLNELIDPEGKPTNLNTYAITHIDEKNEKRGTKMYLIAKMKRNKWLRYLSVGANHNHKTGWVTVYDKEDLLPIHGAELELWIRYSGFSLDESKKQSYDEVMKLMEII